MPTSLLLSLAIYFVAGMVRDGLTVLYYRSVSLRWVLSASTISGLITFYDYLVIVNLIVSQSIPAVIAYGAGTALGTYIAMRIKPPKGGAK